MQKPYLFICKYDKISWHPSNKKRGKRAAGQKVTSFCPRDEIGVPHKIEDFEGVHELNRRFVLSFEEEYLRWLLRETQINRRKPSPGFADMQELRKLVTLRSKEEYPSG